MRDIAIIGGGINGCGIARDAAGRGLSVLLAEKDDLASGTSSASTKLIHGGLRYLEHYNFRLVRELLREREVLLAMAPHIIRPMRFVLPHHRGLRPAVLIRLGLFLYDHLGGRRSLPPSKAVDLTRTAAGAALKPGFLRALSIPIAGSTMRASWCSTRWMRPPAAPRFACVPRSFSSQKRRPLANCPAQHSLGSRGDRASARARQRLRRLDGRDDLTAHQIACCTACQACKGKPHCRAEAVRSRQSLYFSERRPPDHFCHPLRAGFHAHWHHGRGFHR